MLSTPTPVLAPTLYAYSVESLSATSKSPIET